MLRVERLWMQDLALHHRSEGARRGVEIYMVADRQVSRRELTQYEPRERERAGGILQEVLRCDENEERGQTAGHQAHELGNARADHERHREVPMDVQHGG